MQSCTIFCTSVQCLPRVRRSSCCGGQFLGKFLATCVTLPGPPICSSSCCFLLRMLTVVAWLGSAFTRLLTGDWPLIPAQDKSDSTGHCLDYECILVRQECTDQSSTHRHIQTQRGKCCCLLFCISFFMWGELNQYYSLCTKEKNTSSRLSRFMHCSCNQSSDVSFFVSIYF